MHEVNITILMKRLYINFMINTKFVPYLNDHDSFMKAINYMEALQKLILDSFKAL